MNDTMQQLTQAETNRLIRAELKAAHPGTVFTVRAANGAGITQTVIGWEIGYRPTSADIDALATRYSSWEWTGDDDVRDYAAERLVATEAGQLPALIRYGAGNVAAYPSHRNLDL